MGVIVYNTIRTYKDSKKKLIKYRNNKLSDYEKKYFIKNEWDAVKYGANENFRSRICESIIWPIMPLIIISDIIPFLVLQLNKEIIKKDDNK
jgi:hypothetical protein